MSGGGKLEIINTRERAVSTDINRLQAFLQYDRAEIMRRLVSGRQTPGGAIPAVFGCGFPIEFGQYVDTTAIDAAPIGTPLAGDVIEGLVVLPQIGTTSCTVNAGCVYLDDPDGQAGSSDPNPPNPDDSRAKLVVDPGIQTLGVLTIAPGGGGTRIDIVECQRQTVIVETDSRDIFDPSTGVFVPTVVNKVSEGRLNYRVRQGTPGVGYPGPVQGWLPLMVASVPSSAAHVEDCTFWDVRPLAKARVSAPSGAWYDKPVPSTNEVAGDSLTDPTKTICLGLVNKSLGMYFAGGALQMDAQRIDFQEPGYTPVSGALFYVYAVFVGSLPRWVRYTGTPLIPDYTTGILTVSSTGPTDIGGATINVPLSLGLANGGQAVCLFSGVCSTTPAPSGPTIADGALYIAVADQVLRPPTSTAGSYNQWDLAANTDYPADATFIRGVITATFTGGTPGATFGSVPEVSLVDATGLLRFADVGGPSGVGLIVFDSTGNAEVDIRFEVPTSTLSGTTTSVGLTYPNTAATANLIITGWKT